MMQRRVWILSSFAALAGLAFFQAATDAQPGTVKQIAPGVWFREGEIDTLGHCNNAIIEMKDYLIVVDANFPSGARLTMEAAKKVSNKPVKYVFDTHHHGDHAYGNPVWTHAGATTLAYKGVTEELKRYEPKRWQAEARVRKDVAELKLDAPEPPKQTFDKSPFILKDDTRVTVGDQEGGLSGSDPRRVDRELHRLPQLVRLIAPRGERRRGQRRECGDGSVHGGHAEADEPASRPVPAEADRGHLGR